MIQHPAQDLLSPFGEAKGSRRGFLQLVGFGLAGAGVASCSRGPTVLAIPPLEASHEYVPGRAYWIASTCGGCEAGCGVLVKCRDGRPIKLEGIPRHPVSGGGLCAAGQASVLSLYDGRRFDGPRRGGHPVSWSEADETLCAALEAARAGGGRVRLLTGTIHGPSTGVAIRKFLSGFSDAMHVAYDGLSASAILEAHEETHGIRLLPRYLFERARTIASFDADFLSTWISPVEFTAGYTRGRALEGARRSMSRHYQLEARTSLTGCRADVRARLAPWETASTLAGLADLVEQRAGTERLLSGAAQEAPQRRLLETLAAELWETRTESLVVAGSDDVRVQVLVNYVNHLLDGYGSTLDLARCSRQRLGDDGALVALAAELERGEVDVLVVQGVNPAYDLGGTLAVERAKLLVACAGAPDETTALAGLVFPVPHALESWDDGEPVEGTFVLTQPTVPMLRAGRTLRESLARWNGDERSDHELLRATWREELFPRASAPSFDAFMDEALRAGRIDLPADPRSLPAFRCPAVSRVGSAAKPVARGLGLVPYPKAAMLDGRHAHNPWLHELPDPVTKIVWDNYACVSPGTAERLGLREGRLVRVSATEGEAVIELPVHVQRGQHDGVVAIALGYGRAGTDRFTSVGPEWLQARPTVERGGVVGVSVAGFLGLAGGRRSGACHEVLLAPADGSVELASTQDHHSLEVPTHLASEGHEVRDAVSSTSHGRWESDAESVVRGHHGAQSGLWAEDHEHDRSWGLSIDLARCTGCSACVVSCQAENNVPVVGRDEVLRHREMSWLRIDRYWQGGEDDLSAVHQPMMCQQCGHAPCESVCPVLATVHSAEGLNQQVYNRCIGTRYCANTCPYKVRRFNWFDYPREDELQNHSLNPDVTVRTRGVMEKCSFCIQRIQEAKAEARVERRDLRDGDVRTACQQSCPAEAIVFGDRKDPESRVAQLGVLARSYGVLEELNVQPAVRYLTHVHNGREKGGPQHDG